MSNYSAQGSITVKRLRNGDSLFITIGNNGIPLYQGVDSESGVVRPNWEEAVNQPVLIPQVTSTRGFSVTLSNHSWEYNGVTLIFNGATSGEWTTDSTGKFQMSTNGSLKIIKNLASKINIANDSLVYSCIATIAGVEYPLTKSVDVVIQNIGASSYYGTILATTEQLTEEITTTTITTKLYLVAEEVTEYYIKWYKDNTEWTDKAGQKQITVGRSDVNGTQLFIAEFYKNSQDTDPVYRAGIRIIDTRDDFMVVCDITSVNKEVDSSSPVTVSAKIVNTRTNSVISPEGQSWRMDVMGRKSWDILKTVNASSIEVTTAETDVDGEQNDVEVVAEVEWS